MADAAPESLTDVILDLAGPGQRGSPRTAFRLLRRYARGSWGWYAVFAAATVVAAMAGLAQPAALAATVNAAVADDGFAVSFAVFAGLMGFVAIAGLVSGPAENRFKGIVSARATGELSERSLLLGLPGRRPFAHGDLLARVAGDAAAVAGYPMFLMTVVLGTATAVAGLVALAWIDWVLLIPFVFVVAVMGGIGMRFFSQTFSGERELRDLSTQMSQRFLDAVAGRRTIRASRTLSQEVDRITGPLPEICQTGRRLGALFGKGAALTFGANFGVVIAVLAVAAWSLSAGRITAGEVVAAMQYGTLAFASAFRILDYGWFQLAIIQARAARVAEVLATPLATPEPPSPTALPAAAGEVDFNGVTVDSEDGRVLDDLSMVVPAGATIAIVGRSGAGKSTIAALAGRLLDPDAGAVLADGIDLRQVTRAELTSMVSYAFERPALLGGTIRDAIALGFPASDQAIREAARTADADTWIERLEHGFATPVHSAPMSGGERQRLGLARAALRRPRLLVLDDALSSLDTATEAKVFEAFRTLSEGRTTILVAHRASTAARADLVAWLADGRIRRVAPHAELWNDPDYRAVFASDQARSPSPGHASL